MHDDDNAYEFVELAAHRMTINYCICFVSSKLGGCICSPASKTNIAQNFRPIDFEGV